MSRAERRRRARAQRTGRLADADAARLNAARRLPNDHPGRKKHMAPMLTTVEEANGILTMLRRSKATCDLAARLDDHSGPTSRLSAEAIVLATCLAAWKLASCTRADVCAVLNGLDAQVAYQLGLCDHDRWEPVSYSTVDKQARRLETALSEGWANADGEQRDLAWFTRVVLAETVPAGRRSAITAVAIDSTFVEAWAVTRDFRREVDAQAEHCQAARNSLELPPTGDV